MLQGPWGILCSEEVTAVSGCSPHVVPVMGASSGGTGMLAEARSPCMPLGWTSTAGPDCAGELPVGRDGLGFADRPTPGMKLTSDVGDRATQLMLWAIR